MSYKIYELLWVIWGVYFPLFIVKSDCSIASMCLWLIAGFILMITECILYYKTNKNIFCTHPYITGFIIYAIILSYCINTDSYSFTHEGSLLPNIFAIFLAMSLSFICILFALQKKLPKGTRKYSIYNYTSNQIGEDLYSAEIKALLSKKGSKDEESYLEIKEAYLKRKNEEEIEHNKQIQKIQNQRMKDILSAADRLDEYDPFKATSAVLPDPTLDNKI